MKKQLLILQLDSDLHEQMIDRFYYYIPMNLIEAGHNRLSFVFVSQPGCIIKQTKLLIVNEIFEQQVVN